MTELLTQADIERMRAEHYPGANALDEACVQCSSTWNGAEVVKFVTWPCDAARLLDFISAYDLRAIKSWWPAAEKNAERMLANGWKQV